MEQPKPVPRTKHRKDRDRDRGAQGQELSKTPSPELIPDSEHSSESPDPTPERKSKGSRSHKRPLSPKPGGSRSSQPPKNTRSRQKPTPISVEDDNDLDASELRRQIDRLERDLQRRDRELDEERVENERCMESIKKLERDKVELKREVEGLKDETEDYKRTLDEYKQRSKSGRSGKSYGDEADESEGIEGYETDVNQNFTSGGKDLSLQQKNKEIEQLLEDNERLDEQRRKLEEKLTTLKDSLSEATKQIESMTNDHFEHKSKIEAADERIKQLEEDNTVLSVRERELLAFKERHEEYLENLCNAVDIRVDVWKKMMFSKDEEIARLNAKISSLTGQLPNTQLDSERAAIGQLGKKLQEREHHIAILNEKLAQATEEIESNTKLIESLQTKLNYTEDAKKTEQLVKSLQSTVRKLEDKLERRGKSLAYVEKEAEDKSKTLTNLMARLTAYESGQYGLPEAVSEIKELKTQLRIRDKQVESVTQEINVLQMQVSDLQEENEMLRDQLGLDVEADVSRDTRRYTRSKKNELSALRSKVAQLEEEVVTLKTRNYSLKKQMNAYDMSQQQQFAPTSSSNNNYAPERDRDEDRSNADPELTQGDLFIRNLTGSGIKGEEWKNKYEVILEENSALRRGLHEILDCMHKMTDEGNTEVMIQAPVLEELLREMSARGIINYPYPISSFHMKVCNLEGKCSQLREELYRIRQEERQCRQELFEAQGTIRNLTEQLQHFSGQMIPPSATESDVRRRSKSSISSHPSSAKHVKFQGEIDNALMLEEDVIYEAGQERRPSTMSLPLSISPGLVGHNLVLEDLQQEIEFLRNQNEELKQNVAQEKEHTISQLQHIMDQANELIKVKESEPRVQLKIEYLQAIKENQANEINSLIRKLSELENENSARLGFLERFKMKALHQISTFQQILETSVPMHLLHNAKKEIRLLSDKVEELSAKEETFTLKTTVFHKNTQEIAELRKERDKLEEELGKCQARLIETAAKFEDSQVSRPSSSSSPSKIANNTDYATSELNHKLNHLSKMNDLLKSQIEELETSKKQMESQMNELSEKCSQAVKAQKEAQDKSLDSVAREEYDLLVNKLVTTEENYMIAKDDLLRWKEMAEVTQNQIRALENIKDFEKMELEVLNKQVLELQTESDEKALLAKAHRHMLSADKEKLLAIQQVQKLLSKLSQLEAHSLQQDKVHQDREMSLIAMHTHVIMRYRNLFASLHETQAPRTQLRYSHAGSTELKEAFEMFERGQKRSADLEEQILEEKLKSEELEQKCKLLENAVNSLRDGSGQDVVFDSLQKVQEARVELARWKRKADQNERAALSLQESVHRLEMKTSELEEDRIKLEHTLELKESLHSTLMANSIEQLNQQLQKQPGETLSSISMPLLDATSSVQLDVLHSKEDKESQCVSHRSVEIGVSNPNFTLAEKEELLREKNELLQTLEGCKIKISELEGRLKAKDEAINEIKFIKAQQEREVPRSTSAAVDSDLQDALLVARETINSLQERLKSKEDNVSQYRRLLADVRTEMTNATERHVQEMRALQMTIHQQQQAFTRMKSTLSQPVKDTLNVEGTIKDQLTRIHELEDEVSELQHAMSNTAAQLTAARAEAHRWRCQADARTKEVDSARDQNQSNMEILEELNSVRQELRETQRKLEDSYTQIASLKSSSARESMTDLVNVLRTELEEKDKQIEAYSKSLHNLKNSGTYSEKSSLEERLHSKETEVNILKEEIKELQKTVSSQLVKISKTKAINYKSGTSAELEELRIKHRDLMEDKVKVDKELADLNRKRDEDELKKIKSAESIARWEESKKWKKNHEKLEARIRELEAEVDKCKRINDNLRLMINRNEKERLVLETKLNSKTNSRSNSASTGTQFSDASSHHSNYIAQGEIAKLKLEIQDLLELVEKTEFEGKEEAEKLKMEVKLLKERIVSQERALTAYQIAQKGDNKVIAEIESMAAREAQFQKEIRRLEEENLRLNLQLEQLRLDTPRLRDRVQHLQRLVEALKAEKPPISSSQPSASEKKSKKSLSELEKTIDALKMVIDKLQFENKKLKLQPHSGVSASASTEKLKTSVDNIMDEKRELMDKVHHLEHENEKMNKKFLEATSKLDSFETKLTDAENKAKSSEMKLRTFLDMANMNTTVRFPEGVDASSSGQSVTSEDRIRTAPSFAHGYDTLVLKMQAMQEELDHKNRLLATAKQSLRAAEKATAPKPTSTSPRDNLNK